MIYRTRIIPLIAITLGIVLVPLSPAPAQDGTTAAASDQSVQKLVDRFGRMYRSVQATGGIDERSRPAVEGMLNEVEATRVQNPDSIRLTAVATQLAILLEDDDRIFELFEQLLTMDSDNELVAQDWLTYFRNSNSPERADEVIERLVDLNIQGDAIRRTLASHLKQSMQYQRAIDYLEGLDLDPANNPQAMMLLAECLFAEHRFQEASDIVESIPESVLDMNPTVKNKIDRNSDYYKSYIELWQTEQEIQSTEATADDLPRAELITEDGRVVIELYENEAPNHVANFITLAEEDFFDGTTFHRVLTNFMAQGGDPLTKEEGMDPELFGTGGPGYNIPDEHLLDDHRMHFTGSVSMANTGQPNTGGSSFYLTFEPTPWLNGLHTVFGRVVEGLDVVREIRQEDTLVEVNILRKRDHEYTVEKLPRPGLPLPGADDDIDDAASEDATDDAAATQAETAEQAAETDDGDGNEQDQSPDGP